MTSVPTFGSDVFGGNEGDFEGDEFTEVFIPEGSEWRFEVPFKLTLKLIVVEGVGEIFGTELPNNVQLQLSGVKYAIYSPLEAGCKVKYSTVPNNNFAASTSDDSEVSEYISEETPMNQYLNLHLFLEQKRQKISEFNMGNISEQKKGPKVLIIGSPFSGKTSLSKILCSYAYKMNSSPVLVNLNPRDGVFSIPGSLTATPISDSFDLESTNGYGGSLTSGTTTHNPKQPLVMNFGLLKPEDNLELYKYQISRLGIAVMSRLEEDVLLKSSGLIIDTPPLSIKDVTIIENIISDFEIDTIAVIGNERLLIDLKKKFKHKINSSSLDIVKVAKSGGVVELDEKYIRDIQQESIREYFHGNFRNTLSPFKTDIDIKDYKFFSCFEASELNSNLAFLPSGDSFTPEESEASEKEKKDRFDLDKYYRLLEEPNASNLENCILAITQLPSRNNSPKDLLNACVLGYAHASKVEDTKQKIKVLVPFPGAFPRNHLIVTAIRYTE
ncbi:Piso0_003480 [Millerozyma farinosa CBS 7064]|uniref:Polynucleotide 5'-hydroxyl-kinase GRC3 n=1 Tax=Pichia sorbitophila (strain ATCC MYA-4447 / BCRC 22081 / CBS 7064 / NBRC 10061 / NRRL Y-12695) TaxID=559304 RepID=G8YJ69_PICSO|nr:Piso0_003480 [Millerozyma farinosa CBS 7064]CCE81129.1 Piso0_003480 [Millerozyma farinosa CBS 7064]